MHDGRLLYLPLAENSFEFCCRLLLKTMHCQIVGLHIYCIAILLDCKYIALLDCCSTPAIAMNWIAAVQDGSQGSFILRLWLSCLCTLRSLHYNAFCEKEGPGKFQSHSFWLDFFEIVDFLYETSSN